MKKETRLTKNGKKDKRFSNPGRPVAKKEKRGRPKSKSLPNADPKVIRESRKDVNVLDKDAQNIYLTAIKRIENNLSILKLLLIGDLEEGNKG